MQRDSLSNLALESNNIKNPLYTINRNDFTSILLKLRRKEFLITSLRARDGKSNLIY